MTEGQINAVSSEAYSEKEWAPLIGFFWERYNKRYFDQIKCLQHHSNYDIRNNCGFLIATIDCILIETLEQFYTGFDETVGKNHDPFTIFFNRSKAFAGVMVDKADAGRFSGLIRAGLLHQSKTKKSSVINKKSGTPILDWVDKGDKSKGFIINRDLFHQAVLEEFKNLIKALREPNNQNLREKFKSKLLTII